MAYNFFCLPAFEEKFCLVYVAQKYDFGRKFFDGCKKFVRGQFGVYHRCRRTYTRTSVRRYNALLYIRQSEHNDVSFSHSEFIKTTRNSIYLSEQFFKPHFATTTNKGNAIVLFFAVITHKIV